ncbi:MAG: hypothetical protein J6F30_07330 [Cellulosilyticum sp.]|nr:hypothetical protein [Cellulosilyticum sp.]
MKKIIIPKTAEFAQKDRAKCVSLAQLEAYFEDGGKAPSIKERLITRAFEITKETRILFESEEVVLLYSEDETGIYLSCFNRTNDELALDIPLSIMNLQKEYRSYCVLTTEEIGILNDILMLQIPDGGVLLVKLIEA